MVKARCFSERVGKERKLVDVVSPVYTVTKTGAVFVKGKCSSCGGPVSSIVSANDAPADVKAKSVHIRAARKSAKGSAKKGGGSTKKSGKSSRKRSKKSARKIA